MRQFWNGMSYGVFGGALLLLAILGCTSNSPAPADPGGAGGNAGVDDTSGAARVPVGMIRAAGATLVDDTDAPVFLRGVAFGNNVWAGLDTPPEHHHNALDYERLRDMGMNAVRFYLNYQLFESDEAPGTYLETGFSWIAQNVEWAKEAGVVLILNIHVPPGGFQSNNEGGALWENEENQTRLVNLWRAIAQRFADEPTIAGYDFLNEPRPTTARTQWSNLAARIADSVRQVDPNHMLVVERTLSVGEDFSEDESQNFFRLEDDNVLYEFHFYSPIEYTHQLAEWTDFGEGGKYPDQTVVSSGNLVWSDWSYEPMPPRLPPGDSDWRAFESPIYTPPASADVLQPVLVSEYNSGTAYFDELVVREYDAAGNFVQIVIEDTLDSLEGGYFWKEGELGAAREGTDCYQGGCVAIEGTDHDANFQYQRHRFIPREGHGYSVGGFMRGQAIAEDSRPDPRGDWTQVSRALFRLDYWEAEGEVLGRTRASLAHELDHLISWGRSENVPLYLGEFGVIYHCYEADRGGLTWVADMLDLSLERDLHFTFHSYHEWSFPIFQSDPTAKLPSEEDAIPGLRELFTQKLQ